MYEFDFSKDMAQCHRVARRMQTGMVGVNEGDLFETFSLCINYAFSFLDREFFYKLNFIKLSIL